MIEDDGYAIGLCHRSYDYDEDNDNDLKWHDSLLIRN